MASMCPLPQQDGLDAARLRTPDRVRNIEAPWATMGQWLRQRLPSHVPVNTMLAEGSFVYSDGASLHDDDSFQYRTHIWFHRDVAPETPVPGELYIRYQDERIVVVDKPAFLATMPRGAHVRQTVLVRLREKLGLPELAPMHRLDRLTSGLLALTVQRRWRGPYQTMFDRGEVKKSYWALAPRADTRHFPITISNHLVKRRGYLQTQVEEGAPVNARTIVELEAIHGDLGLYRLTPLTGRTHQLRVHMSNLGLPIVNDPLYPTIVDGMGDDFASPLQLLAGELSFTDPISGVTHRWTSQRRLPLSAEAM